jgi:hypothetical protein
MAELPLAGPAGPRFESRPARLREGGGAKGRAKSKAAKESIGVFHNALMFLFYLRPHAAARRPAASSRFIRSVHGETTRR